MKELTQEEFNYLQQFDDRFVCMVNSNYCRNIQKSDLERLRDIYMRLTEQPYNMSYNCSRCIMRLVLDLSVPYFEFKNKLENDREKESGETKKGNSSRKSNRRAKN